MQSELLGVIAGGNGLEAGILQFRQMSSEAPVRVMEAETAQPLDAAAASVDLPSIVEAAREEGRREAAATLHRDMEQRVENERANIGSALDAFVTEKRKYFAGLEKEVVRLALAIAERVLHRETAMDPTLLAGAARVVLEQVDQDGAATLLVAVGDADQWHAALATLGRDIAIREEAALGRGECVLQTDAGSFELGLKSQLCEIERGFFELLGRNTAVAA